MMSKKNKHTPTPWLLTGDGMNGKNIDLDEMVFFGCDLGSNTKENAKHIVKCVNENEALHARIKELEAEKQVWLPVNETPEDGKVVILKLKKVDKYGAEFEYITDGFVDCTGTICNDCGDTSEFKASDVIEWKPLPSPPCIGSKEIEMNKEGRQVA